MKTEIIEVVTEKKFYICDYCGTKSMSECSISQCEEVCKEKDKNCEHVLELNFELNFELDMDNDEDYLILDIYRTCSKCDYVEDQVTISNFKIEDYLTIDIIKKLYEENK